MKNSSASAEDSPRDSKSGSPNYKRLKNKLRNSIRKSRNYFKRADVSSASQDKKRAVKSSANVCSSICNYPMAHDESVYRKIHSQLQSAISQESLSPNIRRLIHIDNQICHQQNIRGNLVEVLDICRASKEFRNSSELIESEHLMLVSNLKEFAAKEELIRLWESRNVEENASDSAHATLSVVYLELILRDDAIYEAHFNYYYVCVLSYRDQIEYSAPKERDENRVLFNDLKIIFRQLPANFEIKAEVFVLRLRKNVKLTDGGKVIDSNSSHSSRFRFHGRTILRTVDLVVNKQSQYPAQRNMQKDASGGFIFTMYDIIDGELDLHGGDLNNLRREALVGFQLKIALPPGEDCSGFLNVAQTKWKWDRLWCRVDGFKLNFWPYPTDIPGMVRTFAEQRYVL